MNNNLPLKELSINEIFNSSDNVTYEIPIYQRNYAWEKDEVATLVHDVWDACDKKDAYFIGTLVTYDKGDNTYEVIDGQQRLTTLYLILKALKLEIRNKLTYRARKSSTDTIREIPNFKHNNLDGGIKSGFENAKSAISEIVAKGDEQRFSDYLLNHVRIIHYKVPKDVDLNHYFEVMNSRGEQLEKHEIVKAKLMNILNDEKEKSKFAAIWEACSEMNTYIQTKAGVKAFFEDNLREFKFYDGSFDELPGVDDSALGTSSLANLIHSEDNPDNKKPDSNDDSKNSIFQPIIDFPNFLLIVLKITRMRMREENFNPELFILDDKELINEFNQTMSSGAAFVKNFCFNLLLIRYLLDNFVVHHTNSDETTDENPWKLQRWQIEGKSRYLKNLSENKQEQEELVQLLSMFEVSFTARQRKNYLFYVLYHLYKNRDLKAYREFLVNLSKKYFCDIYMDSDCLNEINTPKPGTFDQAILKKGDIVLKVSNPNISSDHFNAIYGDGSVKTKGVPLFIFNYMDYQIWKNYAKGIAGEKLKEQSKERQEFFRQLGCSDFGLDVFKQFYFSRTRRSLEHYFPQAFVNRVSYNIDDNQINCFGNFAMISGDANSSGSDWSPRVKLDHYLDSSKKFRQVGVASLKFRVMMQMCKDNYDTKNREKGQEWNFEDIKKHQELMLNFLLEQLP